MFRNFLLILTLLVVLTLPFTVLAYNLKEDGGLDTTAAGTGHTSMAGISGESPAQIIGKVIKAILSFLGVVFLVLMIMGGYKWMMAAGNEQQVEKAKKTITAAIVGMVIILAAYAITTFIGGSVSTNAAADCVANGCLWEENTDGTGGNCTCAGS